ncbi:MAG TPA: helix-turn-helix domain-containing protein [Micromonosporaceae bacterium]|nr:helix-turn-helix domain-containing protein [Micromonosporaceae bacterium]
MFQTLRTADLPVTERFRFWRDMIVSEFMPMHVASRRTADFNATTRVARLGAVTAFAMEHSPIDRVARTSAMVRQGDPEKYLIVLNIAGRHYFDQGGRSVVAGPGDITLFSSSRAGHVVLDPRSSAQRRAVLTIPHRALPLKPAKVERLAGVPIPSDSGTAAIVAAHLRAVVTGDRIAPESAGRLGQVSLDLVSVMLAEWLGLSRQLPAETHQSALLNRVQSFISERLGDRALTPEAVAAAHHMSLRSLQRLFEARGETVSGWIRRQRLERCRRDLSDPDLAAQPISNIMRRWGFAESAHFNRLFRQAYGVSPSEFRHQRARGPVGDAATPAPARRTRRGRQAAVQAPGMSP